MLYFCSTDRLTNPVSTLEKGTPTEDFFCAPPKGVTRILCYSLGLATVANDTSVIKIMKSALGWVKCRFIVTSCKYYVYYLHEQLVIPSHDGRRHEGSKDIKYHFLLSISVTSQSTSNQYYLNYIQNSITQISKANKAP